jgi:acylphosphatase
VIIRHVIVHGRVQGVGYRAWVESEALRRNLEGWVRNRRDGTVEAFFFGPEQIVMSMIEACRMGPPMAHVLRVDANDGSSHLMDFVRNGERFSVLKTV